MQTRTEGRPREDPGRTWLSAHPEEASGGTPPTWISDVQRQGRTDAVPAPGPRCLVTGPELPDAGAASLDRPGNWEGGGANPLDTQDDNARRWALRAES